MRDRFTSCVLVLFALPAWASVGAVTSLEGHATRTASDGQVVALKEGSSIEAQDTLRVQDGALEVTLEDDSVLALAAGSELHITEAVFQPGERSFLGFLHAGSLWTSVRKTLEGEKSRFEVSSDHAIAGVRGTVFRMDVAEGADDAGDTLVSVEEGQVQVDERDAPPSPTRSAASRASTAVPVPVGLVPATPRRRRSLLLGANAALRIGHRRFERLAFHRAGGRFGSFIHRRRARALKLRLGTPKYWRRLERKEQRREHRRHLR